VFANGKISSIILLDHYVKKAGVLVNREVHLSGAFCWPVLHDIKGIGGNIGDLTYISIISKESHANPGHLKARLGKVCLVEKNRGPGVSTQHGRVTNREKGIVV